jgi:hypothetical protein
MEPTGINVSYGFDSYAQKKTYIILRKLGGWMHMSLSFCSEVDGNCRFRKYKSPNSLKAENCYFTTGGLPPIRSSWRQPPWESRPLIFDFQLNTCGHSPYVTLKMLRALASIVILRSESRGTHDHILLSQIRDSLNLDGQVPLFISPRKRVAQL